MAGHNQKGISNEVSTDSWASQTSPVLVDNSVTSNSILPCASQPNLNSNLAVSRPGMPPCSSGCPSVQTHSPTNAASIASTPTGIPSTATLTPKTLLCKAVCAQLKEMTSTTKGGKVKQKRRRVPKQRGECLTEKEVMERVHLADEQKKSKTKKNKQATAAAQPHRSARTQRGPPKDADKRSTKRQSTTHEEEKISTDACYICGISEVSDWMACTLCDHWVCSGCLPAYLDKTDMFLCDEHVSIDSTITH